MIPSISILFPAYNCDTFLKEAMESVLNQTYTDFELIIINDGSTDTTEAMIRSFADKRIVYLKNEKNEGLIYTLNKGIEHAQGKYIARMDGDDISLPDRLEQQVGFLDQHPDAKVVASFIEMIDEKGNSAGVWENDRQNVTPQQIRKQLPKDNCIAHPTVMCRAEIFKQYRYNSTQKNVEDYDLWLRLQADGISIFKLDKVLLKYRVLTSSITRQSQQNVFWKNAGTKLRFTWQQLKRGRLNLFILRTFLYGLLDWIKGVLKEIKKNV